MTDYREHLLNKIQHTYRLNTQGAAVRVADALLGHFDEWAPPPNLEDDALAEELWAAAATAFGHGERTDPLLAAIQDAAITAREALAERDDLIRAAMRTTRPRDDIAAAAMLKPARLYQIAAEADPVSYHWEGRIAVLGVPTTNGQLLDPSGSWTLAERPGGVRLVLPGSGQAVGTVEHLVRENHGDHVALQAVGTVTDRDTAYAMRRGELKPQIDLLAAGPTPELEQQDSDLPIFRFRGGQIAAVTVGDSPAWEDVYFEVDVPDAEAWRKPDDGAV